MGSKFAPFKRLHAEPSTERQYSPLPSKIDMDDTRSTTSLEMEPAKDVNGDNRWLKGYSRFGVHANRFSLKCCRSWIVVFLLMFVAVATGIVLTVTFIGTASKDSCVTKEELHEVYRYINESLSHQQNSKECDCNNSLTHQLQDQVNALLKQMQSMQSSVLDYSSQIGTIQNNLTDTTNKVIVLQNAVKSLSDKGNLFESDISNIHERISELSKKLAIVEAYAGNLSAADHLQDIDQALAHGNMSDLVAHIKSSVTAMSGVQDHVLNQITSLQRNISHLRNELRTLSSDVEQQTARAQEFATYSSRLDQMETSVTSLSTKVHSPVSLFDGCWKDKVSCTINPIWRDDYWRDCATASLPVDVPVS